MTSRYPIAMRRLLLLAAALLGGLAGAADASMSPAPRPASASTPSAAVVRPRGALIADHRCVRLEDIPVPAVEAAKRTLHIGYGHTSHGSQIVSGMTGLAAHMEARGAPRGLYAWDRAGAEGALHLYLGDGYGAGDLNHDAGYHPQWVEETRKFLGAPGAGGRGARHPETNVIMWSWCGQLSGYTPEAVQAYLDEMGRLERDYPGVVFVYMTGHADGTGEDGVLHRNNRAIRAHCEAQGKVLFDFYDIECHDPDGVYYGDRHVRDDCSHDGGNWARAWQEAHRRGVDWFDCEAAHTEPLNANQKARAAWWLWARLGGWDGTPAVATAGR